MCSPLAEYLQQGVENVTRNIRLIFQTFPPVHLLYQLPGTVILRLNYCSNFPPKPLLSISSTASFDSIEQPNWSF